jgi:hypothetical protein
MAYSSLVLKSLNDCRFNFGSLLGNCYPDHLFLGERRLFHCIALRLPNKRNGALRRAEPRINSLPDGVLPTVAHHRSAFGFYR